MAKKPTLRALLCRISHTHNSPYAPLCKGGTKQRDVPLLSVTAAPSHWPDDADYVLFRNPEECYPSHDTSSLLPLSLWQSEQWEWKHSCGLFGVSLVEQWQLLLQTYRVPSDLTLLWTLCWTVKWQGELKQWGHPRDLSRYIDAAIPHCGNIRGQVLSSIWWPKNKTWL